MKVSIWFNIKNIVEISKPSWNKYKSAIGNNQHNTVSKLWSLIYITSVNFIDLCSPSTLTVSKIKSHCTLKIFILTKNC